MKQKADESKLLEAGDAQKSNEEMPTSGHDLKEDLPIIPQQINEIIEAASPLTPEMTSQMMKIVETNVDDVEGRLSDAELKNLAEVLKTVTKDSAVDDIRNFLAELKEDREDFKEVSFN